MLIIIIILSILLAAIMLAGFFDEETVEYRGKIQVNYYYFNKKLQMRADLTQFATKKLIIINVYARPEDRIPGKPQTQFLPQGIVKLNKYTNEVYQWRDVCDYY